MKNFIISILILAFPSNIVLAQELQAIVDVNLKVNIGCMANAMENDLRISTTSEQVGEIGIEEPGDPGFSGAAISWREWNYRYVAPATIVHGLPIVHDVIHIKAIEDDFGPMFDHAGNCLGEFDLIPGREIRMECAAREYFTDDSERCEDAIQVKIRASGVRSFLVNK